jgi:hypothetical protein
MAVADSTAVIKSPLNFGGRLSEALYAQGVFERVDQVKTLADYCGVTIRTAVQYLKRETCPFNKRPKILLKLSRVLNCNIDWLYDGTGLSPFQDSMMRSMQKMNEYEKRKILRFAIRMANNDPKVKRVIELFDGGFISRAQFLAMM